MFERFTDRARRVVVLAQEEARMLNHNYIGTEHLLLGLIADGSGVGAVALQRLDVDLVRARAQVTAIIGASSAETPAGHIPFTPRAKRALELALRESLTLNHNYIGTEHVLLGLLREAEGVGAQVLIRCGASLDSVRQVVVELLAGYATTMPPSAQPVSGDRWSPGLRYAMGAATALAADAVAVGTHHLLSVFAERDDLAAGRVLRAGGFDATSFDTPVAQADVANTLDETPAQWGMRVTEVEATDDGVVLIAMRDAELQARVKSAIDAGNGAAVEAAIGEALKQLQTSLPPADPAEGTAVDDA